jgi:hypothetical protein
MVTSPVATHADQGGPQSSASFEADHVPADAAHLGFAATLHNCSASVYGLVVHTMKPAYPLMCSSRSAVDRKQVAQKIS